MGKSTERDQVKVATLLNGDINGVLYKRHYYEHRSMNLVRVIQPICRFACLTRRRCNVAVAKHQSKVAEIMMRAVQFLQEHAFWKSQATVPAFALRLQNLQFDAVGISEMPRPA